ncbi:type I-E CRISPR-associated protein Cas6/Cse3/CasE [Aromatoleum anaerobium]|uniref:Type I-E CRISPR-associated protein Cas6/Cse3/CasE n=1 Tax=Aromatoleum anaerobium TaxID=182180 RepID=A0ABX1PQ61_9RHOO|nr:type I-E CRISPR-associated protein Cas6/Cse3/CasE [Aromatoleum anaerobium]MCK0506043.1 type I-E CRISPR-associated protein Cas6/Cse3/CasE [Aromatoleum anaerobium]
MYLSKLILDHGHPQARRDLADAYEMHRTLCRAFSPLADAPPKRFLWRAEYNNGHTDTDGAVVLVQSTEPGDWQTLLAQHDYARQLHANKNVDLGALLRQGRRYHFRIVANPTVTRAGKRYGLSQEDEQQAWLARQGERYGFRLLEAVRGSSERLTVRQHNKGNRITVQTVRFDGILEAANVEALGKGLLCGIGHGKALGLGMLSLAPARG